VFETLFKYPGVVARHQEGPCADLRERYLIHCAGQDLAQATLQHIANESLVIASRLNLTGAHPISVAEIETAADEWSRHQQRLQRAGCAKWSRDRFVQTAVSWLQFLGRLQRSVPEAQQPPGAHRVEEFASFMRDERGLSEVTVQIRCWHTNKVLNWLNREGRSVDDVALQDVDRFLAGLGEAGWCRVSVATSAKALRSFFQHAGTRGWASANLAAGIEGPRIFRQEALPVGPHWTDVQRLIASADTDKPRDILMLFSIYGFRSSEVSGLCLEDVNWEKELVSIARPKQRRNQQYPLVEEVGEAMLKYLQHVRPRSSNRVMFLTLKAPFRRLSPGALHHLVSTRLTPLGITAVRRGPHCLRHACAGHLVNAGLSLKQIGDHLGHRSPSATRIYAKVDLAGLRQVADFDLGGLL
jgi:integrase/recombinase XerD